MSAILGMPTLIELQSLDETIELCLKLGLSFIELNMNMPSYCPEELDAGTLREYTTQTGINFSLHLPEDIDLASFQPTVRAGYMKCCKDALAWASEAGIKLVNIHMNSGVHFSLPDQKVYIYDRYFDRFQTAFAESICEIADIGKRLGIAVCLENVGNYSLEFVGKTVHDILNHKNVYLTWDVGHDAEAGFADRDVILEHSGSIRHMHLHDWKGAGSHQILYTGKLDIDGMLDFAGKKNLSVVIEVKTAEALAQSIESMRKRHTNKD
ncbi:sugar phosphate isomerase/epimerase [bacterium]|nr:sugar phosphate isomerase/epimerase [bacterium]